MSWTLQRRVRILMLRYEDALRATREAMGDAANGISDVALGMPSFSSVRLTGGADCPTSRIISANTDEDIAKIFRALLLRIDRLQEPTGETAGELSQFGMDDDGAVILDPPERIHDREWGCSLPYLVSPILYSLPVRSPDAYQRHKLLVPGRVSRLRTRHPTGRSLPKISVVTRQRLYQLVRQNGAITDHTFAIKFLDPNVQAFAFTFG